MQYVWKTDTCWRWTGSKTYSLYGQTSINGKKFYAHRVSYELFIGAIPAGLEIDHVFAKGCRHTDCVNPAHLEPVTRVENLRRSRGAVVTRARHASKTICVRGHIRKRKGNCPECMVAYRQENKAAFSERSRLWRTAHPGYAAAVAKRWRDARKTVHPDIRALIDEQRRGK